MIWNSLPAKSFNLIVRGYPKPALTRGGRYILKRMSMIGTFYNIKVIEFLQKCQSEVGRWSKKGQNKKVLKTARKDWGIKD